jgi:hypothetical protein
MQEYEKAKEDVTDVWRRGGGDLNSDIIYIDKGDVYSAPRSLWGGERGLTTRVRRHEDILVNKNWPHQGNGEPGGELAAPVVSIKWDFSLSEGCVALPDGTPDYEV